MNLLELAWAAGFYDGEGGMYSRFRVERKSGRSKGVDMAVHIGQVDRRPLERFRAAVQGLGSITGPYAAPRPEWQPQYHWRVNSFEKSQAVIAMLWRFLSPPKREQAVAALARIRDYRPVRRGRPGRREVVS